MLDVIIFIGRFQPPNLAHIEIIKRAQTLAKKTIILVGSANKARSDLNPWTAQERIEMLRSVKELDQNKLLIIPLSDSNNDFSWWLDLVKKTVKENTQKTDKIGIIGHKKDKSSYYLDHFPKWKFIEVENLAGGLSSTKIRETLFQKNKITGVCPEVRAWLEKKTLT